MVNKPDTIEEILLDFTRKYEVHDMPKDERRILSEAAHSIQQHYLSLLERSSHKPSDKAHYDNDVELPNCCLRVEGYNQAIDEMEKRISKGDEV